MPTYAVLGATGNTGQALLGVLSQNSSNTIHAYCRSRPKLERLSSGIIAKPQVKVFEGSLNDADMIRQCIRNTHAVFMAVAVRGNVPGTKIAQETARYVVQALENIRETDPSSKLPRLVVLSASAIDDHFSREIPPFARGLLLRSMSGMYADLIAAEEFLRKRQDWLSVTFIKPGALSIDAQKGHVLSVEDMSSPVSFLDLAAGMVEVAESGDEYDWRNVSVNPTAKDVKAPWQNLPLLVKGLIVHYFPWLYRWIG